jgi:large subunit ribosomal protein L24
MALHVRKGDLVMVRAGNDRGTTGEVLAVTSDKQRVLVKGVNIRTKHVRPTQANPQGGIIRREMPVHISNVSPVVDGKPTRVRFVIREDGSKVRIAARDGSELHTLHGPRESAAGAARPAAAMPRAASGKRKPAARKAAAKRAAARPSAKKPAPGKKKPTKKTAKKS